MLRHSFRMNKSRGKASKSQKDAIAPVSSLPVFCIKNESFGKLWSHRLTTSYHRFRQNKKRRLWAPLLKDAVALCSALYACGLRLSSRIFENLQEIFSLLHFALFPSSFSANSGCKFSVCLVWLHEMSFLPAKRIDSRFPACYDMAHMKSCNKMTFNIVRDSRMSNGVHSGGGGTCSGERPLF